MAWEYVKMYMCQETVVEKYIYSSTVIKYCVKDFLVCHTYLITFSLSIFRLIIQSIQQISYDILSIRLYWFLGWNSKAVLAV